MSTDGIYTCPSKWMISIEENRHDIGVDKQDTHLGPVRVGGL